MKNNNILNSFIRQFYWRFDRIILWIISLIGFSFISNSCKETPVYVEYGPPNSTFMGRVSSSKSHFGLQNVSLMMFRDSIQIGSSMTGDSGYYDISYDYKELKNDTNIFRITLKDIGPDSLKFWPKDTTISLLKSNNVIETTINFELDEK